MAFKESRPNKITFVERPIEGKNFYIIRHTKGQIRIIGKLDGAPIYNVISECPDPPCHTMFKIPNGTAGKELVISVGEDLEKKSFDFIIDTEK